MTGAAAAILIWVAFFAVFYLSHRQVWAGTLAGAPAERRVRRDRSSDYGMALQFAAVSLVLLVPGPPHGLGWALAGLVLAALCLWWVRAALLHLGRQWRVQAVIAEGHELITSGPFRIVRHPVYLAFLGMMVATAIIRGAPGFSAGAILIFIAGTEIRVRAEERLLAEAFGERFAAYRTQTPWAYLPGVR